MTKTVDMVITGAQVLNVFTREFEATSLWIKDGRVISNLKDEPYAARQTVDATGQWIVPGMIDGHVHMESSMVAPSELGKVLLKHGVTAIATDPHELANVAGTAGIQYLIDDARQTPLDVFLCCHHRFPVYRLMITVRPCTRRIYVRYTPSLKFMDWRK